jgi:ureidoglycolate hydrolase
MYPKKVIGPISVASIGFAAEWHHPLIALESDTELACVVREDGSIDGCRVVEM